MTDKHYVIALQEAYVQGEGPCVKGTIVSGHTESYKARERAEKLNRKSGHSLRKPAFGAIAHNQTLAKGDCHPALADRYLTDKFDADAIHAMKGVLDPTWRSGVPVTDEATGWALEDLGLTLEGLRFRFQDRAQAELDATQLDRLSNAERRARIEAVTNELVTERSEFTYTFPAVAGLQAGRAYYAAQVPYGALVKLFTFDEEDQVPAHLRAQRMLSERRAEYIGAYITANLDDYVLPAITASVSAEMSFEALPVSGGAGRIGLLHIPMDATLLINDGQHRRKGIEHALKECPHLRDETITVTIFFDQGLERSQQMFADINGKQVKPSSAINALYDRRDPFNAWALSVIGMLPGIGPRVDVESSAVPAKSYKLWSLIAFKKFLSLLTGVTGRNITDLDQARLQEIDAFLLTFFELCSSNIPKWAPMINGDIPAFDVREQFVIGHAVWLEALAVFARRALFAGCVLTNAGNTGEDVIRPELAAWERMAALTKVDPRRESLMWAKRCVVLGKMQKTSDGIRSTAARLLRISNVPLPEDMKALERRLEAEAVAEGRVAA